MDFEPNLEMSDYTLENVVIRIGDDGHFTVEQGGDECEIEDFGVYYDAMDVLQLAEEDQAIRQVLPGLYEADFKVQWIGELSYGSFTRLKMIGE